MSQSSRPGLAKVSPPTLDQELARIHDELGRMLEEARASGGDPCQVRAGQLYETAFQASSLSGRSFAEQIDRDARMHSFYRRGTPASAPLECLLRMPKRLQAALVERWAELLRSTSDDETSESQRGAA